MRVHENVLSAIGKTPMVKLNRIGADLPVNFFGKFEATNPGGSIKDRIAVAMIEEAEANGELKPGGTIIEATAGNTGVGLALVAAIKGYKCVFVLPDKMSEDKVNLLKAFGAEVVVTATDVPPDSPDNYSNVAARLTKETPGAYRPGQFTNKTNPNTHYSITAPEIWEDMGGKVDAFVCGVGTGGCISGIGKFLKEKNPEAKIVLADPEGSILSGDTSQKPWKVEGIGEDYIPATYDPQIVDDCVRVSDQESFNMARRITKEEGMFVGGSTGTHMVAALRYAERMPAGSNIVVLFCDTGRNYLGRIFNDQWMKSQNFLETKEERVNLKQILPKKHNSTLHSIAKSAKVIEAIRLMHKYNISQLPVVDDNKVVGRLNEAVMMKLLHDGLDLEKQEVWAVMGNPMPVLDEAASANEAYRRLSSTDAAVVVTKDGVPAAVLTKIDLIDYWLGT